MSFRMYTFVSKPHLSNSAFMQIFTRRVPFHEIAADPGVILKVITHQHPKRPTKDICWGVWMPDELWNVIVQCWEADPIARPGIMTIVQILNTIKFG
jgi:hypothetical protein